MSRTLTTAAAVPFAHAWSLLEAYVDACPEAIWEEKNGGWPVWQQMLHAVTVLDFFTCGEQPLLPAPAPQDVLMLSVQGTRCARTWRRSRAGWTPGWRRWTMPRCP